MAGLAQEEEELALPLPALNSHLLLLQSCSPGTHTPCLLHSTPFSFIALSQNSCRWELSNSAS